MYSFALHYMSVWKATPANNITLMNKIYIMGNFVSYMQIYCQLDVEKKQRSQ